MNHCCLHVEAILNIAPEKWLELCERAIPTMSGLPGLVWKLWVLDEERGTAGGVYLFRDEAAARAYADGPVLERLRTSGAVKDLLVRRLPLVDELSRQTRGLPERDREPKGSAVSLRGEAGALLGG